MLTDNGTTSRHHFDRPSSAKCQIPRCPGVFALEVDVPDSWAVSARTAAKRAKQASLKTRGRMPAVWRGASSGGLWWWWWMVVDGGDGDGDGWWWWMSAWEELCFICQKEEAKPVSLLNCVGPGDWVDQSCFLELNRAFLGFWHIWGLAQHS